MLETALYVSRSTLEPVVAQDVVAGIVAAARQRNAAAGLTGGLLFTGRHFAQVLEGSPPALDALLDRIAADSRHAAMTLLHRRPIPQRFFSDWTMAYNGPSRRIDAQLRALILPGLEGIERTLAVQDLGLLMKEFALLRDAA